MPTTLDAGLFIIKNTFPLSKYNLTPYNYTNTKTQYPFIATTPYIILTIKTPLFESTAYSININIERMYVGDKKYVIENPLSQKIRKEFYHITQIYTIMRTMHWHAFGSIYTSIIFPYNIPNHLISINSSNYPIPITNRWFYPKMELENQYKLAESFNRLYKRYRDGLVYFIKYTMDHFLTKPQQ
ncbi:hypothetical protein B4088_0344 [Bacillus cereus]|uniref:Uncharacterized protein n=1 Tax=Bacillus cereus TaxID=1396 RepID=A0A164QM06_BACCE|nr:hypothetical protein B4088_0344 [Bacillus cereus]